MWWFIATVLMTAVGSTASALWLLWYMLKSWEKAFEAGLTEVKVQRLQVHQIDGNLSYRYQVQLWSGHYYLGSGHGKSLLAAMNSAVHRQELQDQLLQKEKGN